MATDAECWTRVARSLGLEIVAPFDVELSGKRAQFTALLPQFGAPSGMVVDANWDVIEPYASDLSAAGFGFSCVGPPAAEAKIEEMLIDWGWSSPLPEPDWLAD